MILMNIGIQYLIELRNHKLIKENRDQIIKTAGILFAEMLIVLACIPVYQYTGNALLSLAAILFGIGAVLFIGRKKPEGLRGFYSSFRKGNAVCCFHLRRNDNRYRLIF